MSIKLSDSIRVGQQKPLEDKYFNELVPYISTSQVNNLLPQAVRYVGLTVNINNEEYWYKDGIEDNNLILKVNNIDTSNFVTYDNAIKDVNIGDYFYKTSKGFDFTKDVTNYFKVLNYGNFNSLEFSSMDTSVNNYGRVYIFANPAGGFIFQKYSGNTSNQFKVDIDKTSSLKKFETNEGYQIIGGILTQALTADGGVFDLTTKADLVGGKVPSSQLPSYVDDVLEYANLASFPVTGENGKIYIALDTNLTYRWGGSSYVVISSSLALGETSSTAYRGDRGKIAYDHSQTTGNPHGTTAAQVGASPIGHTHSGEIITPNAITIAGSYTDLQAETLAIGTIFYNSDQQCYMQKLSADVYHNFGSELPSLSKIGDNTNHLNGMPVYISSGAGNLKIVSLTNSTIGKADAMATQDVANTGNKTGYYCYFGGVNKFPRANVIKSTDDPATWIEGAELRLCNETGKLSTQIEPAPAKCPVVARITAVNGSNISVNFTPNKSFTVEDASNIDGDTTSIEDTDIILKKESGGLWKKITFANFKNWFTTELSKKINIGLDTVFNFKNISAMTLAEFRNKIPNIETIYFTEEQNTTGWQQLRFKSDYSVGYLGLSENAVIMENEELIELDSDSSFNLINVENTKINGIFENDFMIITFSVKVETPSTPNQWFKIILKINGVQVAVSPVFYLLEPAGMPERISYSFALNVTPEMVTHGAILYIKPSMTNIIFNSHSLTVARVHKSSNANL